MGRKTGKESGVDLLVLLVLIGVLVGGAFLVGRRSRPGEAVDSSVIQPRSVPAGLIRFQELAPVAIEGSRLRGLAVGPDGRIYVLSHFRVLVYEKSGEPVRHYELDQAPHCAAFGPDGTFYLGLGSRLGVLDLATGELAEWRHLGEGAMVCSIAVGGASLMAGDSGNRAVWVFGPDGKELARIDNLKAEEGAGEAPSVHFDVAAHADGTFWATDAGRHAVIHFSAAGKVLGRWGRQGQEIEAFGGCCNPAHLAVFPDGRVLAVEKKPDLVKVCHPDGRLDAVVAPPDAFILRTFLADATVDGEGRVLVLDPKRSQVRIFVENPAP